MSEYLEVIPLGGVGEFGMNCAALRLGEDMILIDAGVTFPGGDLGPGLGVDVIVPEISFLEDHRQQLRAVLLTHGHEDHAGGVSYLLEDIPLPVYGSRLTLGMLSERLKERGLDGPIELHTIEARQQLKVGCFEVEPLHVTHSFPDSFCFAITTPIGRLIWTGDFKFDQTPIDRKPTDITRLADYGEKGVLALFSDSTNSEVSGLASSEFVIYEALRTLFRKARRKIIVGSFASSIHRIQIIFDLAREFGRKVAPVGRSMISNVRVASELGYLHFRDDSLISPSQIKQLPPQEVLILATGSQGEPRSALSRMALNELKHVEVEEGDFVILSARVIPGNEKLISNMINHFYRRGAEIYDARHAPVHVSGHGLRDDLKLMINLTRPRFFVPVHGEYKQLKNHAALARDQGIAPERISIMENGDVLRLSPERIEVTGKVKAGRRFMEEGVREEVREEVHEIVLRDRRSLSEDGFVVVVLRIDRVTGELIGKPELVSRGFVLMDTSEELMEATREAVMEVVAETPAEERQDEELFKDTVRKGLRRFLRKKTGKRPMILPVTIEF